MAISSSDITASLINRCHANEFVLQNVFVYDWESDFLYQTKTGYFVEVEIKISRSDFFADFQKKQKHELIRDAFNKKEYIVTSGWIDTYNGASWGQFKCLQINVSSHSWRRNPVDLEFLHEEDSFGYWYRINKTRQVDFRERIIELKPVSQRIKIEKIEDRFIPNKFYYCCPEGLLKKEDIPEYAGLLYYNAENKQIYEVKKAPHIHKRQPSNVFWKLMARKLWFYFTK